MNLKKIVASVDIDYSSASSFYPDSKDDSTSPPTNVSEPAACLDRLTEKLPPHKVQQIEPSTSNKSPINDESPKLSMNRTDEISVKEPGEKTESLEVFHDASESMNAHNNENSDSETETAITKKDTNAEPTTALKAHTASSSEGTKIEMNESNSTTRSDKNDDADESFTEKANEEVMEKDLPENKEEEK